MTAAETEGSPGAALDRTALRVVLVTDGRADVARIREIVAIAVAAGVRAVQLREPSLGARELAVLCERLHPRLRAVRGLLLVNDRVDVAELAPCDGVHLGQRSLPAERARAMLRPGQIVGVSAHDPGEIAAAARAGADYASLSPILPTACKPGVPAIGVARAAAWTATARLPIVWLGGLDAASARAIPPVYGLAGLTARGAFADPDMVAAEAAGLLRAAARVTEGR